ncbi:MAG: FAD-binding protein, partial [Chloroflexota bacterium]
MTLPQNFISDLRAIVGDKNVIDGGSGLDRNSRDAFWYSPILKPQLEHKKADVIVQPQTLEQLVQVVAKTVQARVPITPRGAGTGNYGQSVPIHGGVLISTRLMRNIIELTPDYAHVEAGVILHTIET